MISHESVVNSRFVTGTDHATLTGEPGYFTTQFGVTSAINMPPDTATESPDT